MNGGGGCADAIGIIVGEEELTVPPGAALSFAYGGDRLSSLDLTAYGVGRGGGRFMDGAFVANYGKGEKLGVERKGTRARVVADLPAGEYVLDAFARMPEGDASYGYRLVVERGDAASVEEPATATVEFEPALLVDEVRGIAAEHGVEAGMIEGHYRVGGEVHTWAWTGGLGTNFEKQRDATFADADIPGGDGAGPVKISGIEFRGPVPVLEELVRGEGSRISHADVTTDAEIDEMLRNLPEGCCN